MDSGKGLDADTLAILTNAEVIALNQDARAAPMRPVRRADGLEVWRKPLSTGETAIILFHRNVSVGAPAPPVPAVGTPVTTASSACLPLDLSGGAMRLRANRSLCLGSIGTCECANPPSPRIGVVVCDAGDATQRWTFDAKTGQINSDARHDLNAGPTCPGAAERSMLRYVTQGHHNEQFAFDAQSFAVTLAAGGGCLALGSSGGATPAPRQISVAWAELGWPAAQQVKVRDLWNHTDLGVHAGTFAAEVGWHEARIFTLRNASVAGD
jgi:hypothetical protein